MANAIEIVLHARDEASATLSKIAQELKNLGLSLPTGPAALFAGGIAAAGVAAFTFAKIAANTGEQLLTLSKRTGVSVESLSELRLVAEENETSLEAVANSFRFLARASIQAQQGSEEAASSFRALGISVDALRTLSPEQLFNRVADGIAALSDTSLQSTIGMRILGRGFQELLPLMQKGSAEFERGKERARALGLTISTETAVAADRFNDNLNALRLAMRQLVDVIGNELIPIFTPLVAGLIRAIEKVVALKQRIGEWSVAIAEAHGAAAGIPPVLEQSTQGMSRLAREGASPLASGLKKVGDNAATAKARLELVAGELKKLEFAFEGARLKMQAPFLDPLDLAEQQAALIRLQGTLEEAAAAPELRPAIRAKTEAEAQAVVITAEKAHINSLSQLRLAIKEAQLAGLQPILDPEALAEQQAAVIRLRAQLEAMGKTPAEQALIFAKAEEDVRNALLGAATAGAEAARAFQDDAEASRHAAEEAARQAAETRALTDTYNNLQAKLDLARKRAQVFGGGMEHLEEQIQATRQEIETLLRAGLDPTTETIQRLRQQLLELEVMRDVFQTVFGGIQRGLSETITGVLRGTQTMEEGFRRMAQNIALSLVENIVERGLKVIINWLIEAILQMQIFRAVSGGGGGGFNFVNFLSGLFGAGGGATTFNTVNPLGAPGIMFTQRGGFLRAGQLAMVGESGPELFLPRTSGTVIPNDQLGGITVQQVFNVSPGVPEAARAEIFRMLPFIKRVTEEGVIHATHRGGAMSRAVGRRRRG